jgi:acetylornithine deacetylase/succinyl-diaminopimelate desuccinylase-like protein
VFVGDPWWREMAIQPSSILDNRLRLFYPPSSPSWGKPVSQTEKLLRELIALPSVNPAFLPANDPRAGEQRMVDFLAATVAPAGLDIELQPVLPGRPNFVARLESREKTRRRIVLAPHLDTVNAPDSLFAPRKKDGRLFGRGASDTKGSVAAMVTALRELAQQPSRPAQTEILFAGLVDEENGQAGSRALAGSRLRADLAIVGEPTCLQVVTAHKGDLWMVMRTRGLSAHGARPELGRNAVHAMARVVDLLETEYAAQLRRRRHPLLGRPTINVGSIRGGTQANIVPDSCEILVDRRTLPGETEPGVEREIQSFLRKHGLEVTFDRGRLAPCEPLETNPKLPLVAQFLSSIGQRKPAGVNYFCDASVLSRGGIPSIVFGPGDIAQGHTADEWIELDSLERGKDMLLKFLRSLP